MLVPYNTFLFLTSAWPHILASHLQFSLSTVQLVREVKGRVQYSMKFSQVIFTAQYNQKNAGSELLPLPLVGAPYCTADKTGYRTGIVTWIP